jgi:hypothetical protein
LGFAEELSPEGRFSEPPTGGGRNAERDFHGEKRTNATHASTTDPDARLYRKSSSHGAKLCHMGHLTMENRHGLIVETEMTPATGWSERAAAEAMIEDLPHGPHATLAADKAYDTADFVATCASRASYRTSRRIPRTDARPLTDGQRGTRATAPASVPVSGSRKLIHHPVRLSREVYRTSRK